MLLTDFSVGALDHTFPTTLHWHVVLNDYQCESVCKSRAGVEGGGEKQNKWVSTGFDPILKGDLCRQRAGVCVGVPHSNVIPVSISVSPVSP